MVPIVRATPSRKGSTVATPVVGLVSGVPVEVVVPTELVVEPADTRTDAACFACCAGGIVVAPVVSVVVVAVEVAVVAV